jgi:hypothetical protein
MSAKKAIVIAVFAAFATLVTANGDDTTAGTTSPTCATDQDCIDQCTKMNMGGNCNLFTCGDDKSCKAPESHDTSKTSSSTTSTDSTDSTSGGTTSPTCATDQDCIDQCTKMNMGGNCNLVTCGDDKSCKAPESQDTSTTSSSTGPTDSTDSTSTDSTDSTLTDSTDSTSGGTTSPTCATNQDCIDKCTAMKMGGNCNLFLCGDDKSCKEPESHDESSTTTTDQSDESSTTTTDQSDGPPPCETDQNCKDKCNSDKMMKASGMCDAMVCDAAKLCSFDSSKVLPFCESEKLIEKCEATCMTSSELKGGNSPASEGCMLPPSRPCGDGDCDPFADVPKSAEEIASEKTDMCGTFSSAIKTTCETCVDDATNSSCNDMHESPENKHETRMAAYAQCIDGKDAVGVTACKNDALERAEMQAKLHGVPKTLFDDGEKKMLERAFAELESIADTMNNPCGKLNAGDAQDLCNDCSRISK